MRNMPKPAAAAVISTDPTFITFLKLRSGVRA